VYTLASSPHHELVLGIEHTEAWHQEEEISGEGQWPPGQGVWLTIQPRVAWGPGAVVWRTGNPVQRGGRWSMRQGFWPTVWHRVAWRPGVVRQWPSRGWWALSVEGRQEAKPAPWVVAEELPIPAGGMLLGKHPPNGIEMPDFRLVEVV